MSTHAISAAFVAVILGLKQQESVRQTYEGRRLEISNLRKASAKKRKCKNATGGKDGLGSKAKCQIDSFVAISG